MLCSTLTFVMNVCLGSVHQGLEHAGLLQLHARLHSAADAQGERRKEEINTHNALYRPQSATLQRPLSPAECTTTAPSITRRVHHYSALYHSQSATLQRSIRTILSPIRWQQGTFNSSYIHYICFPALIFTYISPEVFSLYVYSIRVLTFIRSAK